MPSSADLPFGDNGPVSAIEKPIVSGWPDGACACAGATNNAVAAANEATKPRQFGRTVMLFLQFGCALWCLETEFLAIPWRAHPTLRRRARRSYEALPIAR